MAKPDNVLEKRMVNALIKGAEASGAANKLLGGAGKAGLAVVEKMMGGLWVGGTAFLTPETVEFYPNALNKMFHKGGDSMRVVVPLVDVTGIEHRFGIGTKIIDIATAEMTLSVRCYKSKAFADAIEAARTAA